MSLYQSSANRSVVYRAETAYGVRAPNDTQARVFRQTGGSGLRLTKATIATREIRRDLQTTRARHGMRAVAGSHDGELSAGTYTPLLEAALRGTWSAPVNGLMTLAMPTTPAQIVARSFTVEEQEWDIAASLLSTGCRVTGFALSIAPGQTIGISFDFVGQDQDAVDGTNGSGPAPYFTTPTQSATTPFVGTDLVLTEGGAPVADITSFALGLTLGASAEQVIGALVAPDVTTGKASVTASMTFLRRSLARYRRFRAETVFGVSGTLVDGDGNTLGISLPAVTLGDVQASPAADNGTVVETCPLLVGAPPGGSMLTLTSSL